MHVIYDMINLRINESFIFQRSFDDMGSKS